MARNYGYRHVLVLIHVSAVFLFLDQAHSLLITTENARLVACIDRLSPPLYEVAIRAPLPLLNWLQSSIWTTTNDWSAEQLHKIASLVWIFESLHHPRMIRHLTAGVLRHRLSLLRWELPHRASPPRLSVPRKDHRPSTPQRARLDGMETGVWSPNPAMQPGPMPGAGRWAGWSWREGGKRAGGGRTGKIWL